MLDRQYEQYKQLAKTITKGDERYLDLLHDVLVQLQTNENWNNLTNNKEKMYFLTRVLQNQFNSQNSKFQRTYRKFTFEALTNIEIEEELYVEKPTIEWINELLDMELKLSPNKWYEIGIFKLYMQKNKIDWLHKKTKIPKYSLRETIKQMKVFIKTKWEEYGKD